MKYKNYYTQVNPQLQEHLQDAALHDSTSLFSLEI